MLERRRRIAVASAAALALTGGALSAGASGGVKVNHENDKRLGPKDNAGEFLGFPSPTYQWHGCTMTAVRRMAGAQQVQGEPVVKGNRNRAVTFTAQSKAPFLKWKTKPGYRICGVQITTELSNPTVDSDLLASAGYTSFVRSGSTSTGTNGRESIKVRIKNNDINRDNFRGYEGKTYSIGPIHYVIVFVKRG